jgi:hypothetical protein
MKSKITSQARFLAEIVFHIYTFVRLVLDYLTDIFRMHQEAYNVT